MGLRLHSSGRATALAALFGSSLVLAGRAARAQNLAPPPATEPAPATAPATVPAPPPPPPPPPPVVDAAPPALPVVDAAPPREPEPPLAGYRNGLFYLRSPDDNFRFYVQGRVYADALAYFGPGVSSLAPADALKTTATVRRARLDLSGEVLHDWQWAIGAEFGQTGADNPGANTSSGASSVDPATGTLTTSNRQNPVEASVIRPIPTDAFVNYGPTPWTNIEVGQFYLPFSFENRLSDNYTPFLDRSFVIRNIATNNSTRDIGVQFWGESPDKLIHYAIALQNGDGQNRLNADNRYDVLGRVVVKPFAPSGGALKGVQIGVSGRTGSRDPNLVGYDATALTTQGGYSFWKPTYKDSLGRTLHIIPAGEQTAYGVDLYAPVSIIDFTGEFVYSKANTREAVDNYQLTPFTERFGSLKGWGYYLEAGVWVLGDRDAIGRATFGRAPHVDLTKPQRPPQQALELLAKYEQAHLTYDGAGRGGALDSKTPNGDIDVKALSFGVNYWATKHVRVSLNYSFYSFPDSEPVAASSKTGPSQSSSQRAVAPGQLVPKGVDDEARDNGHVIHEMQARVQMSF